MDILGLVTKISSAATSIDYGRKGFATKGKAEEGRLSFERGIELAMSAFKDAQSTIDPYIIILILIEYTFLTHEFQFCDETDIDSYNSLTQAIQNFEDAFVVLQIAEEKTNYHFVDKALLHHKDYRVKGFPKDSYHAACLSHITRIRNILRSPGIDPLEKALLKQRRENMYTAQKGYLEKQKKAMAE